MAQSLACGKCGASVPDDAPEHLCPKCLIVAGLMSEIGVDATPTVDCSASDVTRAPISPALPTALPGSSRFGGYQIIRPLGKGGMGAVYEAQENASGRRMAIKVLAHSLDSEQARARFFREGRLAASINHPNSVYVFGTEEIDGMPVISMELVSGGTLQELVKRNSPLPVAQAVDAIVQVIAGLEAAAAGGVLHRDVKPSNCFIDSDGTVKVGDFGLSISTLARREITLTTNGTMLGTPAYAAPEQLRGDEIDCRSDIYSVGVTLYYLLTARIPFSGDNIVRLLATVLEQPAESPRKLRKDIPEELAQVVLRCLAKQPSQRFRTYNELRLALLPFYSDAPPPAGFGLRFLAGFVDGTVAIAVVIAGILMLLPHVLRPGAAFRANWIALFMHLTPALIFVLPEGLWGATLGKALFGLRVVGRNRRLPGIPRALLRAIVVGLAFAVGVKLPTILGYVPFVHTHWRHYAPGSSSQDLLLILAPFGCTLLLLVTARRKNGQAALQDLLSGTRVVLRPEFQPRLAAAPTTQAAVATEGTPQIGPYHVLARLEGSDPSGILIGYDARLFRRVWIRQLPAGEPQVLAALRGLTRSGRLRWLGGKRSTSENWDAYEALSGQPLKHYLDTPQPWGRLRFWLADLADELDAAAGDQTTPHPLTLDRVWITEDGHAKLLDFTPFRGPNSTGTGVNLGSQEEVPSHRTAQQFLMQVAIAGLEGRYPHEADLTGYSPQVPMPLHARNLVTRIGSFPALGGLASALREALDMPAEISAARRLILLAGCVLPPITLSILAVVTTSSVMAIFSRLAGENRQLVELKLCLNTLNSEYRERDADRMRQSLEIYIAGRFSKLVNNPQAWNEQTSTRILSPAQRQAAEQIVRAHPNVSERQFNEAAERIKSLDVDLSTIDSQRIPKVTVFLVAVGAWAWCTGVSALIAAALFRGGILLHGLGLAVVTLNGRPARRWRVLARGMIVWAPPILAVTLLTDAPSGVVGPMLTAIVATYLGAALWSLRRPDRGVQDWIARTWMVPR